MKIYPEMIQGSEEWLRARKGRLTASQMSKVITATGKLSAQWEKLAIKLAAECVKPEEAPACRAPLNMNQHVPPPDAVG